MADLKQIQFKRSKTAGARPTTAQIAEGELAINLKDRTFFTSDGTQIIDLSLSKGGQIDGNITQSGSTIISNELTVGMDINAKRNVLVSGHVVSGADLRSDSGVIRTRAAANANSHVWFEGEEMTRSNYERAVMYASPQTAAADGGGIRLRVQNGTQTGAGQSLFLWTGSGDFTAPRDLYGQRGRFSSETISPVFNGNTLYTAGKPASSGAGAVYTIDDRVNYRGADGDAAGNINYLRAIRATQPRVIFHELADARTGSTEISWWTGLTPEEKISVMHQSGSVWHKTSLSFDQSGRLSGLGPASIALGDNDTGIKWNADGKFSLVANSRNVIDIDAAHRQQFQVRKQMFVTNTDNDNAEILPAANTALLQVNTQTDGNNHSGNGLTFIGYADANGNFQHYFRGKGTTWINTEGGLSVTSSATISGQATIGGRVVANSGVIMNGDSTIEWSRNTDVARISFKNDSDGDTDSYMKLVSGDNGNEYFKFVSLASTTERPLFDIRYGDNFSHYKLGIGGSRNTFGSNNSLSLGWGQTGFVAESSGVLTAFANGQWITKSRDDGSVEINGNRHAATNSHQWNNQYGQYAPVHINTGVVSGTSDYYPAVRHVTQAVTHGYRTALDFGTLREGGSQFGVGIIRVATDERAPGAGQDAIFKFTIAGNFIAPGSLQAASNVTAAALQLHSGAQLVADGNIYLPGATNGFSSGWLLGQINSRLNTAQSTANTAQSAANTAQSTANGKWTYNQGTIDGRVTAVGDGRYAPLGTFNSTAIQAVRYGAVKNFGSLNQTSNQRICDQGYFMVGMNGTGGQQNNSMNVIAARIQVKRLNGTWVDSPVT